MNLRETILEEHSRAQTLRIVKWVGKDKKRFAELVKVFLKGEYRVTQRAAWPLSYCVEEHPELAVPHYGKLIDNLSKPGQHPSVFRNTMRLLQEADVPEKYLGKLVSIAFDLMLKVDTPIAVKVFSMTVLANIAKKEPDLKQEIEEVVKTLMVEGGPAIQSRGKRTLKLLGKIGK